MRTQSDGQQVPRPCGREALRAAIKRGGGKPGSDGEVSGVDSLGHVAKSHGTWHSAESPGNFK